MSDSKPLNYNLRWIERTFNSRAATEALLAPEREAGNVSHNDYDAAVQFSTSVYPYYRFIGALLGTPITIALRRPSWGNGRTFGCLLVTTFAGSFAGQAMTVSAHLKFIRSLENPSGFGQAIENIQKNSGLPFPRGPTIVRKSSQWSFDTDPSESPTAPPSPAPVSTSTPDISKPSISPASKWDQIRAVNTRTSANSSWDALRQNHERARVAGSTPSGDDTDVDAFKRSRDDDRAAEQAKFNEMLERERNMK